MTKYDPVFSPQEFELRRYTNPYLTPEQSSKVQSTETRVNDNLDFLAQTLGWSGPNYWSSLVSTVDQKRQILGGTYGVYNSFIVPKVYEIRNWDNTIVIDRLQFVEPNRQTYVERVVIGDDVYQLQSVKVEGDKYVVSIGALNQSFYDQIAANVPLKIDIPTYRPAPFRRSSVGVSGDCSFFCSSSGSQLTLYPAWDAGKKFPYLFPILFAGSVYYFNQPVYFDPEDTGIDNILPSYDPDLQLWYLQFPDQLAAGQPGIEGSLVWSYSDASTQTNASLTVKIQTWADPSDWGSINVLDNYRGTWNNKGGFLPFNFVFDSLSLHGFDEKNSLYLESIQRSVGFNDIVNQVYSQQVDQSPLAPGDPYNGQLWWNPENGVLSAWLSGDSGCGYWVEVDYRSDPFQVTSSFIFVDVPSFIAGSGSLTPGTIVTILDVTGLSISQNVIGIQGTLTSPGSLTIYRADSSQYWTPVSVAYANIADFSADAIFLPYGVPVKVYNGDGLSPDGGIFQVSNLNITISGDYEVVLTKVYRNTNWEISEDFILRYIGNTSLFSASGYLQGEMWWDFAQTDPNVRGAATFYQSAWVAVNYHPIGSAPAPTLDMSTVLFYANGNLLEEGVSYLHDNFSITYTSNPVTGLYNFTYTPRNYLGKVQLPSITISDSLTTTYTADISVYVFGGIQYKMSPNVFDAEATLRLWKGQDLQDAETIAHLAEDNYINPLVADLNNGPGPENWERYFVRLPLDYGRDGTEWQKVSLVCQDFGYWGSTTFPEKMRCPPENSLPAIYEELFLYDQPVPDYTYVYCEPYLYSNIAYTYAVEVGDLRNSGVFPASDQQFDEFFEAELVSYEPLHARQAFTDTSTIEFEIKEVKSLVSSVVSVQDLEFSREALSRLSSISLKSRGDWVGDYVNVNPCATLTGFLTTDLFDRGVEPVGAPVWDASIYKFPPTCDSDPESYSVDTNHYRIGYAYFVADASAADEGFFDPQQEAAWRFPVTQPKTLYLTPR